MVEAQAGVSLTQTVCHDRAGHFTEAPVLHSEDRPASGMDESAQNLVSHTSIILPTYHFC